MSLVIRLAASDIHYRHANVHDDHVGTKLKRLFDSFSPLLASAQMLQPGWSSSRLRIPNASLMVVGYQNRTRDAENHKPLSLHIHDCVRQPRKHEAPC